MGERASSGGEVDEHRSDRGPREPVRDRVGPIGGGQGVVQGLQFGADLSGAVGEDLAELTVQPAAAADSGDEPPAGAAARAGRPEAGVRDRAAGA